LEKSGRKGYRCPEEKEFLKCTKHMDDAAFNVYTIFYTHTENVCFFRKSEDWNLETEKTINKLSIYSKEMANNLEKSFEHTRNLDQLAARLDLYMHESIDLNQKTVEKLNVTPFLE